MVVLMEVAKVRTNRRYWKFLVPFFFLAVSASGASPAKTPDLSVLNDCNWMVTYRGKIYDLAPLTREALARPIETDLRYALQRVPESNEHLNRMTAHQKDAKFHTILASVFLSGLILNRVILQAPEKNTDKRREYDIISGVTAGFFLGATLFSWRSTQDAKEELVKAVSAFNEKSPHKIEPQQTGADNLEFLSP